MSIQDKRSPYGIAIDASRDLLVHRAQAYKWLVIAVSLSALAVAGAALLWHPWCLTLEFLALPELVLIFFLFDMHSVQCWRSALLREWTADCLRLNVVSQTLRQVSALPPHTLEGMLLSLPAWPSNSIPAALRGPLCHLQTLAADIAIRRQWVRAMGWLMGWFSVSAALCWHMASLLGGLLVVPIVVVLWQTAERFALRRQSLSLVQTADAMGISRTQITTWTGAVCWEGVPTSLRLSCLAALTSEAPSSIRTTEHY